jgi:pyruvate/2-oxoglutarate dehydrogenase complex dihydrolipoamide dehydrogenase (E3) component
MKNFDAIIIGSGQGGAPLSRRLAEAGYKTALIEKSEVGGTCVNDGCTPTKAMITSAKMAHGIKKKCCARSNRPSVGSEYQSGNRTPARYRKIISQRIGKSIDFWQKPLGCIWRSIFFSARAIEDKFEQW